MPKKKGKSESSTPVPVVLEVLDLDILRLDDPDWDWRVPIDHRTCLGTTASGISEMLGFERLPIIRRRFGEGCKLMDIKVWLEKQGLKIERLNWTDVFTILRQETQGEPLVREPVSKRAGLILEKLKSLPEHDGMDTSALLSWLSREHKHYMDDGTLRRLLKELQPYGLQNKPKVGYFIR